VRGSLSGRGRCERGCQQAGFAQHPVAVTLDFERQRVGGPAIAEGVVLTTSGYPTFGGRPGNVLLAFSVDGK